MTDEQFKQITARLDAIDKKLAELVKPDDWMARIDPRKPFPEAPPAPNPSGKLA